MPLAALVPLAIRLELVERTAQANQALEAAFDGLGLPFKLQETAGKGSHAPASFSSQRSTSRAVLEEQRVKARARGSKRSLGYARGGGAAAASVARNHVSKKNEETQQSERMKQTQPQRTRELRIQTSSARRVWWLSTFNDQVWVA